LSQLQKAIGRIQRREGPRIGFGAVSREKPRAMLLGVISTSASAAKAALDGDADLVVLRPPDTSTAASLLREIGTGRCAGAILPALGDADAEMLREAGCDFVITTLAGAAATAVDPEKMGHVVAVTDAMEDTTLRALGPLGLDGLYIEHAANSMSLAGQLELVRLSSFSSSPLIASIGATPTAGELRVLRDSGVAAVVAPEGTSPEQITALAELLKSVPPPRKPRREGGEIALVPTVVGAEAEEEEEEEGE
jgi:methylmalonyl-CoA mutase cobalamin-binding subunit